jgi:hypothetical protein
MSVFLVVYTSAHLIGAVSYPLPDMDNCQKALDWHTDHRTIYHDGDGGKPSRYAFKCEKHKTRPKAQIKINAVDRYLFESNCFKYGLSGKCDDMPKGYVEIPTSERDEQGSRSTRIMKSEEHIKAYGW